MPQLLTRSIFEEVRRNRQRTALFLGLGILWMSCLGYWTVFAQLFFFGSVLSLIGQPTPAALLDHRATTWCGWGAVTGLLLWGLVALLLYFRSADAVPRLLGAHFVSGPDARRLENLLTRLRAKAGPAPTWPKLWTWDSAEPNALAVGRNHARGSIVVTRGLLDRLDEDELEAVLGHELAHLVHRDSAVVVQAVAFVSMVILLGYLAAGIGAITIAVIALTIAAIGAVCGAAADSEAGIWFALVGLALGVYLFFLGIAFLLALLVIFGALLLVVGAGIRCAASSVSQSREYLADARAIEWTKHPQALAMALRKVALHGGGSLPFRTALAQPLLFSAPQIVRTWNRPSGWMNLLLKTHPRVESRIARLEEMAGSASWIEMECPEVRRPSPPFRWVEWAVPLITSAILAGGSLLAIPRSGELLKGAFSSSSRMVQEAKAAPSVWGAITEHGTRLRVGPSLEARVITQLGRGTRVEVFECGAPKGGDAAWCHVRVLGSRSPEGWVARRLILVSGPGRR